MKDRQVFVPPRPELEEVSPFNYGVFLFEGWFYQFISVCTSFYPQEAFLKKRIVDPEDEDGEDFREVTERQSDYTCPSVRTWHVSKCRAVNTVQINLYSYKGVVNSLAGLQNLFPRVSASDLMASPISNAPRPSEQWQPVKWNSDFERWVSENAHLPREERQPPKISKTPRPEYSLAAARHGTETLARRGPLPFLDDSRKD